MLFNSFSFLVFFPVAFVLYWHVFNRSLRSRNLFLIAASYFFYGYWDWRFLSLIVISSLVDYSLGISIQNTLLESRRKFYLLLSILVNIGFLVYFKYVGFFVEEFVGFLDTIGYEVNYQITAVVLPVGISFYTFQTMSYTIDVYRRDIPATKDILAFFAYVSFFPQLVAGPIERAKSFLSQFLVRHEFNYEFAASGMRLMLWGFFKKVVIADNCGLIVDHVYGDLSWHGGGELTMVAIVYAFQIYCDFSGYSDIAIGLAKLFGFQLSVNFLRPYNSIGFNDFWKRWHITLTSWFRDYVYIPLGGNRVSKSRWISNILLVFLISGLWHGAYWTFILWGGLHGLFLVIERFSGLSTLLERAQSGSGFSNLIMRLVFASLTFAMVTVLWVVFRANTLESLVIYFEHWGTAPFHPNFEIELEHLIVFCGSFLVVCVEYLNRNRTHSFELAGAPMIVRYSMYTGIILSIFFFGMMNTSSFIYFQF